MNVMPALIPKGKEAGMDSCGEERRMGGRGGGGRAGEGRGANLALDLR